MKEEKADAVKQKRYVALLARFFSFSIGILLDESQRKKVTCEDRAGRAEREKVLSFPFPIFLMPTRKN